jgi:hypothetical protein
MHDPFEYRNFDILLVDSPGFDNAAEPDISVLEQFVRFLRRISSSERIYLSGIIYLHRITDVRMGGSATKNLQLIRELCGDHFLKRVTLVTTMWNSLQESVGVYRENELMSNYWAEILGHKAMYDRHDGSRGASMRIIDRYLDSGVLQTIIKSNIEQQVLDGQKPLQETDAGRFALKGLREKVEQYARKLEEKKETQKEFEYDGELEQEAAQLQEDIKKREEELEYYKRILAGYKVPNNAVDTRNLDGCRTMEMTSEDGIPSIDMSRLQLNPGTEDQPDHFAPQTAPFAPHPGSFHPQNDPSRQPKQYRPQRDNFNLQADPNFRPQPLSLTPSGAPPYHTASAHRPVSAPTSLPYNSEDPAGSQWSNQDAPQSPVEGKPPRWKNWRPKKAGKGSSPVPSTTDNSNYQIQDQSTSYPYRDGDMS